MNASNFWSHVVGGDYRSCWIWLGAQSSGYGRFRTNDKLALAHRVAYELMVGEIPEGLQLDHLCRNRACVNPHHLDPVTPAVNQARSPIMNGAKTHCKRGHEFNDENTHHAQGRRHCRVCRREAKRLARAAA